MRVRRIRVLGSLLLALAIVAGACGDDDDEQAESGGPPKPTITIGTFNFSESAILANIYAGALEDKGYPVNVRANLGTREVVAPALEKGEIDMYPGYAATDLEFFNNSAGQATPDGRDTTAKLNALLTSKGSVALEPSPAVDQNAFAVTRKTADQFNLKKLSDVTPIGNQLTLGGPPECPQRPFCQQGLQRVYGITFKEFKALDAGGPLSRTALKDGDVQMALIFSSDGSIKANDFVILEDDKKLQNADNVVPVIRANKATDEVRQILNDVSSKLTTEDLVSMNKAADVDKEDPEALAKTWLDDHGFKTK